MVWPFYLVDKNGLAILLGRQARMVWPLAGINSAHIWYVVLEHIIIIIILIFFSLFW